MTPAETPYPKPEIPDSPHARAVLHRRAVRLASEGEQARDQARRAPRGDLFLAVRLGAREHYGIPYRWLDEIARPRGVTKVPGTPAFVAGVMARRGQLLAVLDLARLLRVVGNEECGEDNEETRLVLVSAAGYSVGLRVAEVLGNDRYRIESLGPPLPGTASGEENWITGIHAGRLAMLDLEALLGDPRIRIEEPS